jgi:Cu-Zn family superoxide dismutase
VRTALIGLTLFAISGCASIGQLPTQRLASAVLKSAKGLPAGTALVAAAGDTVSVSIAAAGLGVGIHGVHLHSVGKCEAPAFASAGPHLNPAMREHGQANPKGSHLGDLPNLVIAEAATGTLTFDLPGSRSEVEAALFDADGAALVIHAAADDYRTDPTGNSGARIACGALIRN